MSTNDPDGYRDLTGPAQAVVWAWGVIGLTYMVASFTLDRWNPSSVMVGSPNPLEGLTGLMIAAGSASILAANATWVNLPSARWKWETMGCIGTMGGWFTYTVTGLMIAPAETTAWIVGAGFTAASILRILDIRSIDRITRQSLRDLKRKAEGE